MHLTSNTIYLSCRCNNQWGYFLLFFCHGRGRMSESNAQITAAILIETSEWIPKVYTERIATDTFSLGQPHYYFFRLWKGKGLTDLLEATLVIPPPVHSYCHRMRHLSPTRNSGKTILSSRTKSVFLLCQGCRSLHMVHCSFPNEAPSRGPGVSCPESLPGILIISAEISQHERPHLTRVLPECLWSLPHPF